MNIMHGPMFVVIFKHIERAFMVGAGKANMSVEH